MFVHSEMKILSGDDTNDMLYFCHPEIEPPKGHDYSKIQTKQDINNSFPLQNTHLHFH